MESLKKLITFLDDNELKDLLTKVLTSEGNRYKDVELKDLFAYLPITSIDEIFLERLKKGEEITYFLPFVSHETLKNLVELYCNDKLDYSLDINKIALFLDKDDISLLYQHMTR